MDQWSNNNARHIPEYSQTYAPPPGPPQGEYDLKSPYEGDRFKPTKRINDPIFLILFILTVRSCIIIINDTLANDANSLLVLLLSPP